MGSVIPAQALARVLVDELIRCGLREAVLAPGSRSAPLALALDERCRSGDLRLHVRIDERSACFLALGLAKASGRPTVVVCTSGTAGANFHPAVVEADEAGVALLVLTADRPPELRGTGANQVIDQVKLYGSAVRWFCEVGVPERRAGQVGYWRSLACRAWAAACGGAADGAGPVHLNVALREPLVSTPPADRAPWPEPLDGRPGGAPWTRVGGRPPGGGPPGGGRSGAGDAMELDWTERGLIVCGDGVADPGTLAALAEKACWPVLAEPSSGARRGKNALSAYPYLLESAEFMGMHGPDVIVSAGRPGLSRAQLALLAGEIGDSRPVRHIVVAHGADVPGRWADPARTATEVTPRILLRSGPRTGPGRSRWLADWLAADAAARAAADTALESDELLTEPRLARDLAAALPDESLLWAASSLPIRDLDRHMAPRNGLRVLANRGASGIDGLVSSAIGAALAHQADGGGPAAALLGDLALLHDVSGLALGPEEPRPDVCLVVANNDGGGIFSTLEQAHLPEPFERVFGTPHQTSLADLAAAFGLGYALAVRADDLAGGLGAALSRGGLSLLEVRTERAAGARLRADIAAAATAAAAAAAVSPLVRGASW